MTRKQIKELERTLPKWENRNPPVLTKEQKILQKELEIRDMMLSNLTYGGNYFDMTKESWYIRNLSKEGYDWEQLEKLGIKDGYKRVQELWEEMKNDFEKHATIEYDVYTDCEGLSYNHVYWDDEK